MNDPAAVYQLVDSWRGLTPGEIRLRLAVELNRARDLALGTREWTARLDFNAHLVTACRVRGIYPR